MRCKEVVPVETLVADAVLYSLRGWGHGNWRVTFRIEDGDAYDVDQTDYH